jgi:hypothetical protein
MLKALEAIICLAIFPPTLNCSVAGGETLVGLQLGAGLELVPSERSVIRVEAGSLPTAPLLFGARVDRPPASALP